MTCDGVRGLFPDRYDGELDEARSAVVEGHLAGCHGCRAEWLSYRTQLDEVSRSLLRTAAGAVPMLPFPQLPQRRPRLALLRIAMAGALLGLVTLVGVRRGPQAVRELPSSSAARAPHAECRWHDHMPADLTRLVSYPVMADECIEGDFELVRTSIQASAPATAETCPEAVRLTYRAASGRHLTIDQRRAREPACCNGEPLVVGHLIACLEVLPGVTSLRWQHLDQGFHLRGDLALDEALAVADRIADGLGGV